MRRFIVTTYDYPCSINLFEVDNEWNIIEYDLYKNAQQYDDLDSLAYWLEDFGCVGREEKYLLDIRKWMEKYDADEIILISSGMFECRIGKNYFINDNKIKYDLKEE